MAFGGSQDRVVSKRGGHGPERRRKKKERQTPKTGTRVQKMKRQTPKTGTRAQKMERFCKKPERGHIRQNHPAFTKPPFVSARALLGGDGLALTFQLSDFFKGAVGATGVQPMVHDGG